VRRYLYLSKPESSKALSTTRQLNTAPPDVAPVCRCRLKLNGQIEKTVRQQMLEHVSPQIALFLSSK